MGTKVLLFDDDPLLYVDKLLCLSEVVLQMSFDFRTALAHAEDPSLDVILMDGDLDFGAVSTECVTDLTSFAIFAQRM